MGKIISFINQKGGVGKTTTCVNVASYLCAFGKSVLLVDLDPQGNASTGVGVEKHDDMNTFYDILLNECTVDDAIIHTDIEGLDILPSNVDLAGSEITLSQRENRERVLRNVLSNVKNKYDYITIDCPPSLSLLTVNALTASDTIVIPIQCEFYALEGLTQLMNTVKLVKQYLNPDIGIEGVVLTMKDNRSNLVNEVADEIKKFFGKKVYETVIPRNIRLAEAPSHGLPIVIYDNKCSGAMAYRDLTIEFLKRNKDTSHLEERKNLYKGEL